MAQPSPPAGSTVSWRTALLPKLLRQSAPEPLRFMPQLKGALCTPTLVEAIADVFSRGLRKKILAGRAFDCDAYGVERVLVNDVALSLDSLDWTLTSARDHESHISCLESSAYLRLCYHNAKQARGPLVLPRSSTRMCRGVPLAKAVRAPGPSRRSSAGFPRFLWHVVFTEHFPSVLHALCRPMVPLVALRFFLLRALSLPCFDFAAGPPTGPVFVFTLFLGLFPRPWTGTPDGLP